MCCRPCVPGLHKAATSLALEAGGRGSGPGCGPNQPPFAQHLLFTIFRGRWTDPYSSLFSLNTLILQPLSPNLRPRALPPGACAPAESQQAELPAWLAPKGSLRLSQSPLSSSQSQPRSKSRGRRHAFSYLPTKSWLLPGRTQSCVSSSLHPSLPDFAPGPIILDLGWWLP